MPEFEELVQLYQIIEKIKPYADIDIVANVANRQQDSFPLHVIRMGASHKSVPTIGFFAGVHGLERIGTKVLLSYLSTIAELMPWDHMLHSMLKHVQFIFMPIVNPVGMFSLTRSNGNGVDIMRNAPIESQIARWYHIWAGHRLSPRLPWYRGQKNQPMEVEAQALVDVVHKYLLPAKASLAIDLHSGFGIQDQLWFPYAYSRKPFRYIAQALELKKMLDRTYPYHVYRFEPQSVHYQSHGDLWDYLFFEHGKNFPDHFFMPLTLELGSWAWIKKSPKHIFSLLGMFNPIKEHRKQRTFRRHLVMFDFLTRAMVSHQRWVDLDDARKQENRSQALQLWGLEND